MKSENNTTESKPDPITFFERPGEIQNINQNLDKTHGVLRGILAEWLKVTNGGELSIQMIRDEFIQTNYLGARSPAPDQIMFAVMRERVKSSPLFGEIDLRNLIAITINKPDITDLITAVNGLSDYYQGPVMGFNDVVYWQCFQIVDNDVIRIDAMVEMLISPYRFTARTSEEHHRLHLVNRVIDAMNPIIEDYRMPINKMAVFGFIATDGKRLYPDPAFVIDNRIYESITAPKFEFNSTAEIVGDIRSPVPLSAGYGPGDVHKMIAEKRNKRTN